MKLTCQEQSGPTASECGKPATHLVGIVALENASFIVCDECAKFYDKTCKRELTDGEKKRILEL
jgi:ribosome-binding protein aMBF1 (putative translation factor)